MKRLLTLFTISLICLMIGFTTLSVSNAAQLPYKVYYNFMSDDAKKQVTCLAENIYYEAGFEPEKGKVAVAFVTINRVNSGKFEDNICDVVKQKIRGVCQFSWYCEKNLTRRSDIVYNEIISLAAYVYANYEKLEDPSKGALFYHADYVKPGWKNMEFITKIGRHIFYTKKDLIKNETV